MGPAPAMLLLLRPALFINVRPSKLSRMALPDLAAMDAPS